MIVLGRFRKHCYVGFLAVLLLWMAFQYPTIVAPQIDQSGLNQHSRDLESIRSSLETNYTLDYSGILKGARAEIQDCVVDSEGCSYVTGSVASSQFPILNAYDPGFNGGDSDCFVMKFSPNGTLLYSTFIGGSADETGTAICVDDVGDIYVGGRTYSSNFPVQNANQSEKNGNWDGFVLKLNAAGNSLLFSTYFGGESTDMLNDIAVDSEGNVYATGETVSANLPLVNPIDGTLSGQHDIFVFKLSSSGSSLVYSTYIGEYDYDDGHSIAVDSLGCAYVSGRTNSGNFPTVNPIFGSGGGMNDCFLLKIAADGTALEFSTIIGGSSYDQFCLVEVGENDDIYVTGYTHSGNFPITTGSYDTSHNGETDIFAIKINSSLSLVYSTLIGGSGHEIPSDFVVDSEGSMYIFATTGSEDIPSVDALYPYYGELSDTFVCKVNPTGEDLDFASPFGGSGDEQSTGIAVDSSNNIILTGITMSPDFPVTHSIGIISEPINGTDSSEGFFVSKLTTAGTEPSTTLPSTPPGNITTTTTDQPLDAAFLISIGSVAVIIVVIIVMLRQKPM